MFTRMTKEELDSLDMNELQREMDLLDREISYLKDHGSLEDYEAAKREYVRMCRRETYLFDLERKEL